MPSGRTENLPTLRQTPDQDTQDGRESRKEHDCCQLTADLRVPATEPHDILLMQEIRTWLRSLPEAERLKQIRKLSGQGDKSVLRAMLTVPPYLTGVDEELLVDAPRRCGESAPIPSAMRRWRHSGKRPMWRTAPSRESFATSSRRRHSRAHPPHLATPRDICSATGAEANLRRRRTWCEPISGRHPGKSSKMGG